MTGIVYLVGAGPGDPRLLTLRGAEVLRRAEVVIHDRLVSAALLDLAPSGAERVDAGKAPGHAGLSQQAINRLLLDRAGRQQRRVVRLKGGDPFVFGRGSEEALACAAAGIPFEVVPGVSAAVAAPASAGIPVTHRGVAASFAVVTATLAGGAETDLSALARAVDTLIVMMGAARLDRVCTVLLAAGRPPDEPAAVIQSATTPEQRSVACTLAKLPLRAAASGIGPPATLVVGWVAAFAHVLAWHRNPDRIEYPEGTRREAPWPTVTTCWSPPSGWPST
jgi:uroporphyrin-III C-methyltransferase